MFFDRVINEGVHCGNWVLDCRRDQVDCLDRFATGEFVCERVGERRRIKPVKLRGWHPFRSCRVCIAGRQEEWDLRIVQEGRKTEGGLARTTS